MIGRADIERSKSNVAMNACAATQAWLSLWVMGGLGRGQVCGYQDTPLKYILEIDNSFIKFNIKNQVKTTIKQAFFSHFALY